MKDRLQHLQALRGIACLLVVLFHLRESTKHFGAETPGFSLIEQFGFAGVDLFFVISGFIITATSLKKIGRPREAPRFLLRRFWRIYPLYWVAMGITALTFHALLEIHDDRFHDWPWWMSLVPMPFGETNRILPQAWTLSYELLFYLAFSVVFLLPRRLASAALCGWGVVIVVRWNSSPAGAIANHLLSPYVLEFLAGCFVAWIRSRGIGRGWRPALVASTVWVVGASAFVQLALGRSLEQLSSTAALRVAVFGPPCALILYAGAASEGRVRWRAPRWLLALGDASYSIYLLHTFVFAIAMFLGYRIPHTRLPHHVWMVGALVAAIGAGWLGHRFLERPLLNLLDRKPRPDDVKETRAVYAARVEFAVGRVQRAIETCSRVAAWIWAKVMLRDACPPGRTK